ncbi:F-box protein DOR [Raphanus sativus]|nr:F-box protein DOR [Raphanus sativus]
MKKKQASPSAMISPRRRKASEEDRQTIRRRRSSRLSADELLSNITIDLVIEIFSRLPLKSIARCRCVSKQWASALRRPDFTELFFTKSSARPQLLFAREKEKDVRFFTALQPQNLGENVSIMAADHHG